MPHITITLLPGRTPEQKKSLARRLKEVLACELDINPVIVSVSVKDLPMEGWNGFLTNLPEDEIVIPENECGEYPKDSCPCC